MARQRTADQYARRFLAKAFRHDTIECQQSSAAAAAQQSSTTRLFRVEWRGLLLAATTGGDGAATLPRGVTRVTSLQVTLFDTSSRQFFGATHQADADRLLAQQGAAAAPLVVWSHTESVMLCVELLGERDDLGAAGVAGGGDDVSGRRMDDSVVLGWACCPLSSVTALSELDLVPGSAMLMYLPKTSWPPHPKDPSTGAPKPCPRLALSITDMQLGYLPLVSSCVPCGVFAPAAELLRGPAYDAVSTGRPLAPYRCTINNIQLSLTTSGASSATDGTSTTDAVVTALVNAPAADDVSWSVLCCAHSGYKVVTAPPPAELQMHVHNGVVMSQPTGADEGRDETAAAAVGTALEQCLPLGELPNLDVVHAVVALRAKKKSDAQHQVLGYLVVPLHGEKDKDVRIIGVPVLRGPFTSSDASMSSLEYDSPYAVLPLVASFTISYYDTPVAARRVEELIAPKLRRPEPHAVQALVGGDTAVAVDGQPVSPQVAATSPEASQPQQASGSAQATPLAPPSPLPPSTSSQKPSPPLPSPPSSPQPPAASGDGAAAAPQIVYVPVTAPQAAAAATPTTDIASYKLLCKILEDLDQVRQQQERLSGRLLSAPSSLALGPRRQQTGTADHPSTAGGGGAGPSSAFEVVDIAPMRCGISFATRCAMAEGMQALRHPVHGTPLSDGVLSEGPLPHSILGLRLEGITVNMERVSAPQRMVAFMSFGNLPLQALAVLHTQHIVEEDGWRTHRIASSSSEGGGGHNNGLGGYVWCEPVFDTQDDLTLAFKCNGNVHLHFYDAVTMFYYFSATVSTSMFQRPLEAVATLSPLDLSLFVDYSLTEKTVPSGVLPVQYNVGQLHLTLMSVGTKASRVGTPPPSSAFGDKAPLAPIPSSHRNVIIAKKISDLDAAHVGPSATRPAHSTTIPPPSTSDAAPMDAKNRMHVMRAQYVKDLMSRNGGAIPGIPQNHTARKEGMEMEYRLRFVEKKRDEAKAATIAEILKQRLTTPYHVCVAGGRIEVCHIAFENPLPVTSTFQVSLPDDVSAKHLRVGDGFAKNLLLGPRETVRIPLLVRFSDEEAATLMHGGGGGGGGPSATLPHALQAVVRGAERGETMKIATIHVTFVKPIVDRRFEIFGAPGSEVTKRIFSRLFSNASLPSEKMSSAAASEKISALCAYCTVSDATTTANTSAVIDPITQSSACAWEEVSIHTMIPVSGAKLVFVNLYRDAAMTRHLESWELTVFPCQVVNATSIMFGRTTSIALPITTDKVYVNDPNVVEVRPSTSPGTPTALRFKPREVGTSQCLLHVLRDGSRQMDKVLLVTQTHFPSPTFQYSIELSAADAQVPLLRRFLFVNRESEQRVFHVLTNYKNHVQVTPKTFALGPGDSQHLSLEVVGLSLVEGQSEGRWPMWIFVNDQTDGTVESYFLNVVVRLHRPFF